MKAELLMRERRVLAAGFGEVVVWRVPAPLGGSIHDFKCRLAYIIDGVCVLRFDNEAGKGDHKHIGGVESALTFSDPDELLATFKAEIARWNDENRDS